MSDSVPRRPKGEPSTTSEDVGDASDSRSVPAMRPPPPTKPANPGLLEPGGLATMRPPKFGGARASPVPQRRTPEQPFAALTDPPARISVEVDISMASDRPDPIPSSSTPAPSGVRFGRYEIIGRLATGGMAEIFLAIERTTSGATRQVIVKLARASLSEGADFDQMFMNEGRVQLLLTHQNICHVYEVGKENGRHFIAMEYVNGVSLRELVRRASAQQTPLPVSLVLRVGAQVAEALDFAHRARDAKSRPLQIVHRDVSPHNIMISYDGAVKLLDFGVATGYATKSTTQSGTVKGKFNYMSPEQCMAGVVDGRTDIFALGVCMWEALAARLLFKRETQYETFRAIIEDPAPPVSSVRADVPPELESILSRALAKKVEDRYLTAGELQDDLEKLLAKQSSLMNAARVARFVQPLYTEELARGPIVDASPEIIARLGATRVSRKPRRTRWVPLGLAITAAVVALAALIIALTRGDGSSDDATPVSGPPATEMVEPQAAEPAEPPDPIPPSVEEETADDPPVDTVEDESGATTEARASDARDERRSTNQRTMRTMRAKTPGFVTDPGF